MRGKHVHEAVELLFQLGDATTIVSVEPIK